MTRRRFSLAWIAVLLLPGLAQAQSLCVPTFLIGQGTPAYQFARTMTDSLAYAKSGGDRTEAASHALARSPARSMPELLAAYSSMIYEVKASDSEYRCAARLVQPFRASDDQAMRTAANAAEAVYSGLVETDEQMVEQLVGLLNNPASVQPGNLLSRLSDLGVKKVEVGKGLLIASAATTHALVDRSGPADKKLSRLSITKAERADLLRDLESKFGVTVRRGIQAGQPTVVGAAALIHGFLSKREWKSLDD